MATQLSDYLLDKSSVPKSKRKLQKHLRSAGLAYISRTGKVIPAKEVAAELCQCPHKCDANVPLEVRRRLFAHFYGLGEADLQNQFLRRHMDLRARLNVPDTATATTAGGRPPRRITCKYLVPLLPAAETVEVCQKAFVSAFVITTKRVRLQREKLISSLGLNSYSSHNRSKTSPPLNNNTITLDKNPTSPHPEPNNNVTDKNSPPPPIPKLKIKLTSVNDDDDKMDVEEADRPKTAPTTSWGKTNPKQRVDNPLIPFGLVVPDGVTICPVIANADHDRDIAIVNNFFSNQLWKPEYIGAYS